MVADWGTVMRWSAMAFSNPSEVWWGFRFRSMVAGSYVVSLVLAVIVFRGVSSRVDSGDIPVVIW